MSSPNNTPPSPAAPQPKPKPKVPMAGPASLRRRHWGLILSFLLVVVVPSILTAMYLYIRAADQYVSSVGFSVRAESVKSPMDLLRGLGGLGSVGGGASDTDILYEFIQSQELVELVDDRLDLVALYSRPENDPVFSYDPDGSIEDLMIYWNRMVRVFYDSGAGLIELRVHAFTPEDAKAIADVIFAASSDMINELSAIAREDATRYAREDLERALERLKGAREVVTEFRSQNQLVDPEAEIVLQTGIMTALQQQYSDALIELDLLKQGVGGNDPRIRQAEQRLGVIERRIEEERGKYGAETSTDLSDLVGEYERLSVDREFAERAYLAALSGFESSLAEARRKSRYLAAYLAPTLAERPLYPRRMMLACLVAIFAFFVWALGALIFYSVKDRR